ncbi:ferredoxin [Amycolatopsis taiwanensis]|uniref:Ferredoxin n=1 Tax=Amycolatopsis taiwanensis TaxID=342230 RepID=A0A9W6R6K1_9PSEU|nr:ferredoxin [Amycolatopsis taiwanensis]GLY70354.1 hypothetical protein Atai01_69730 [Amycolatopsis taiwanensis]
MPLKVTVDLAACQGYACCMTEAPTVFDLDESAGKATVLQPSPSDEQRAEVENAARTCPAKAITVTDG